MSSAGIGTAKLSEQEKPDTVISVCAIADNDERVIGAFLREAVAALGSRYRYFEILIVDNHSTDGTRHRIQELESELANLRVIRLSRHCSREVAFSAALEHCVGDYVVTLGLRSDPVAMIGCIMDPLLSGTDVIIGARKQPPGSFIRRFVSRFSRRVAGKMLHASFAESTGVCFGFSRRAVNSLIRIQSKTRFIIYDSRSVGFKNLVLEYEQIWRDGAPPEREPFLHAFLNGVQMTVAHSLVPLRIATLLGLVASILNLFYLFYVLAVVVIKKQIAEGWLTTSVTHTVMFLFLFIILVILTEYIGRILEESKNQPLYFVEQESLSTVSWYDKDRLNIV